MLLLVHPPPSTQQPLHLGKELQREWSSSDGCPQNTGGFSDRSCATASGFQQLRVRPPFLKSMDSGGGTSEEPGTPMSARVNENKLSGSESWSTPRRGVTDAASNTLAGRDTSFGYSTPRASHGPSSMLSPLKLVGSRSPCSIRLTGSAHVASQTVSPPTSDKWETSDFKYNRECNWERHPLQATPKAQRKLNFASPMRNNTPWPTVSLSPINVAEPCPEVGLCQELERLQRKDSIDSSPRPRKRFRKCIIPKRSYFGGESPALEDTQPLQLCGEKPCTH